jgi:hypothetical protein
MDINCRQMTGHTTTPGFADIWTLGAKIHFPRRAERRAQADSAPQRPCTTKYDAQDGLVEHVSASGIREPGPFCPIRPSYEFCVARVKWIAWGKPGWCKNSALRCSTSISAGSRQGPWSALHLVLGCCGRTPGQTAIAPENPPCGHDPAAQDAIPADGVVPVDGAGGSLPAQTPHPVRVRLPGLDRSQDPRFHRPRAQKLNSFEGSTSGHWPGWFCQGSLDVPCTGWT